MLRLPMQIQYIYEDEDMLVVNKPPSMPVHPDKTGSPSLYDYIKEPNRYLGLVHRIDRPTSGIVLFTWHKEALVSLNDQLQRRAVTRRYWAVTPSVPQVEGDTLEHYIIVDHELNKSFAVPDERPGSRKAEMRYRLLAESEHYVLLEVELLTGRHHQIRAQLAAVGTPVKGDIKYGAKRTNPGGGIHLHAREVELVHPRTGAPLSFTAPPPADRLWDALRESVESAESAGSAEQG